MGGWDGVVGAVTWLWAGQESQFSFDQGQEIPLMFPVWTGSGVHAASQFTGY